MITPESLSQYALDSLEDLKDKLHKQGFGSRAECAKEALRIVNAFVEEEDTFVRREQSD